MPQAQVTAKFVNPPKQPGGKYGSIKLTDGQIWPVKAEIINQIPPNQPVTVEYQDQTWGGESKRVVMALHFAGTPSPAPAPQYQAAAPQPASQRQAVIQPAPASSSAEMEKARCIFVTGVVQQAMATGKFDVNQIHELTATAASAFDVVLGGKRQSAEVRQFPTGAPAQPGQAGGGRDLRDELNDEIPF